MMTSPPSAAADAEVAPTTAAACVNRGNALCRLGQYEAGIGFYERALALAPELAVAHYNQGIAWQALARLERAVASFDRALAVDPAYAEAYDKRGAVLRELGRPTAAVEDFERALALRPNLAPAHCNYGIALRDLGQLEPALARFDRALALQPDFWEARYNRGAALFQLKRYEAALIDFAAAHAARPDFELGGEMRRHTQLLLCDWRGLDVDLAALDRKIANAAATFDPYFVMVMSGSPALQRRAAETWASTKFPASAELGNPPSRARGDKLRIGYFSADFRNHPVGLLIAETIELHDRSAFDVLGISLGPDTEDEPRRRLEKAFDRFIDARARTDREIALRARELRLDIAVDLTGYTEGCRPAVFALRAAPLQLGYLGYPGTMGAPYFDYLLADATIIPEDQRRFYSEKILYLPSYFPNDSQRLVAPEKPDRSRQGLPAEGFVFCCFNGGHKILPERFAIWMRILARVPASVLWLGALGASPAQNLRNEAARHGIEPARLRFATREPAGAAHLARHALAGLFLDTLPYNAHTTASDALRAGVPLLTQIGTSFAGRVAASLLQAVGLPELIVATAQEYEDLAVALATDPLRLSALRDRLAVNSRRTPLFDTPCFVRHLESAYQRIAARYRAGLPPEHLIVDSEP